MVIKMDKIRNFTELTRAYSIWASLAPCLIIYAYTKDYETFSYWQFFLMIIGVICVHLASNLLDDYSDVMRQVRKGKSLQEVCFNSFVPKARLIKEGVYSLSQVRTIICSLFLIGLLIGIYFVHVSGNNLIAYIVTTGILCLFYPISSKLYLAELTIGVIFGPLLINGGYFALTGLFRNDVFVMSLIVMLTTIVLLHVHSLMDWEFDIQDKKKTLALLSGTKKDAIGVLTWIMILAYLITLCAVTWQLFNPCTLCVFLTLPLMVKLRKSLYDFINIKDVKFEPKWYYGIFENWKEIKEKRIDFFMYRFYLARNYSFMFCLLLAIGSVISVNVL